MLPTVTLLAGLASVATAAKTGRTFAVNHFYGNGPLTMGRMDPIISPGTASGHVHAIQGGSNFALTMSDDVLLESKCTSSLVINDKSNYWTPALYFQDPTTGKFTNVEMFYMNVYYFFEATDDEIVAFQPGHRMVVGNALARTPPATGGKSILDTAEGIPQPVQWTCPRSSTAEPLYPVDSTGTDGVGIQDPQNAGAGAGFPDQNCDGYASPLRADIHFPSCYNPAAGLDAYKTNMVFPSSANVSTPGMANCPAGWVHTPHIFYEVYWNTPVFASQWTQGQGKQPFVLAEGDNTGYSLHADFIAGWDVTTLQQIIDNCDAGDSGMDKCPGLIGGLNDASTSCNIPNLFPETIAGVGMDALPGNNPVTGWGTPAGVVNATSAAASTTSKAMLSTASSAAASSTSKAVTASSVAASTSKAVTASSVAASSTSKAVTASKASSTSGSASASAPAPSSSSITGWTYKGCYSDNTSTRALTGITFADIGIHAVTNTKCAAYCGAQGYSLAGTEYAGQCFCGNELIGSSVLADSKCNMACEGDASEICGGSNALTVYSASGSGSKRNLSRHTKRQRSRLN